jgi:anaerobic magnesium-protoporphyrin IX monomethyl ester cyclase
MRKILLINPHGTAQDGYTNPPLGLLYLAGTLMKNGISVRVADACLDGKEVIGRALAEFRPDVVGITCLTPGRKKALEAAKMVKKFDPSIQTVLGGAHPTIMYRQLLEQYDCIDLVAMGEGEQTLLEIANGIQNESIAGIAYREKGEVKKTPQRPYIADLDDIPFPAWDLIDFSRYRPWGKGTIRGINLEKVPRVSVIFSRGCKGHCDFCSTWWIWRGWRHRSPSNMADELEWLYRDFGIRHFCFADDAFTINRNATAGLCDEIIKRRMNIAFFATTRTDCVDEDLLRRMKEAGCYEVSFGIETGSQQLLNGMTKENEIETAAAAIKMTKDAGLKATALLIVGSIGETEQSVQETLAFLKRTKPDQVASTGGLWILPGTKVYQHCKKLGFIDDDFWLSDEPYKVYTMEHSPRQLATMCERLYTYSLKSRITRFRDRMVVRICSVLRK